ncbi:hypothetical protein FQA39_LY10720 [Lamprigera yunnana]|nr:hypothetical protein FQA39_LY10720 [Lamprigera yunnana]
MEWSQEVVFEFLDAYENEPVIWQLGHPQHKNRNCVNDAWSGSDDVYKPTWFAFERMERFLHRVSVARSTYNSESGVFLNENKNNDQIDNSVPQQVFPREAYDPYLNDEIPSSREERDDGESVYAVEDENPSNQFRRDIEDVDAENAEYYRGRREDDVVPPYPYLNDEIPSSREERDDGEGGGPVYAVEDENPSNQFRRDIEDVDAENAEYYRGRREDDVVPPYPYLNDEIPSSREERDDGENVYAVEDENPSNQFRRDIEDVDAENAEYYRGRREDDVVPPYPYLNDEIPSSREERDDGEGGGPVYAVEDENPSNQFRRDIEDVDAENAEYYRGRREDDVVPPYPYLNDEIPSSREERDDGENVYAVEDENPSNQFRRDIEDVDAENADREERDDGEGGGPVYAVEDENPSNQFRRDIEDVDAENAEYYRGRREDDVVPPYPYLNDEIPSSREERDDGEGDGPVYAVEGENPSNQFRRDIEDVDAENANYYRRRRDIGRFIN